MRIGIILFFAVFVLTNCGKSRIENSQKSYLETSFSNQTQISSSEVTTQTTDKISKEIYDETILDELSDEKQLFYNDFDIQNTEQGLAIFKNGEKVLFIKKTDDFNNLGKIGLKSLVPNLGNQLIYLDETGMICCQYFNIVEFSSGIPRIIYQSSDYNVSEFVTFDLENDGILEFYQYVFDFRYELNLSGASSPHPKLFFAFDKNQKKYLPIKKLTNQQIKEISELKNSIEEFDRQKNHSKYDAENNFIDVLNVLLTYIYAGKRDEGWHFYDAQYKAADKREIKQKIEKILAESKSYNALYSN